MKKKFDAVRFQREMREELSNQYISNRNALLQELKEKYGCLKKDTAANGKFKTAGTL